MESYSSYLMAYFWPEKKLYYAVSRDARNWTALNSGKPVMDPGPGIDLRDPFLNRVRDKYHLVHTHAWDHPDIFHWDHPDIFHWESDDLIHWAGGSIPVVSPERKRAWAPEFFYDASSDLIYLFWSSEYEGHNVIHYVTTRDWSDITPERSQIYFDLGIHNIDLTIVEWKGSYYGFHKPGDVDDRMGNRLSITRSLDPSIDSFARDGYGKDIFPDSEQPTEGPEVIQLIGEERWYIYGDPFNAPMEAWETTDFETFTKIEVSTPKDSKHCSMIPITEEELNRLLAAYPPASDK